MQAVKVEQLKQRLLSALDEEKQVTNVKAAGDAILLIERTTLTKESLEESRLGLLINEVRRKNQSHFPDFAKRCRALIKEWQKLISSSSPAADQRRRQQEQQQQQQANYCQQQQDGDPVKQYPVNNCQQQHDGEPLQQIVANDKQKKGSNTKLVSPTAPPLVDVALTLAAVAPVEEDSNALDEPSQLKIRIKFGRSDEASIVRTVDQITPVINSSRDQTDLVGIEQAENRRKRKHTIGSELVAPPGVLSLTSANGEVTPKTNGNFNGSDENSPTSSAFGMANEETESGCGAGGIQANAAASRLPKLKSTAALVAEMTKSYPDTVAVHIDDGVDHSPIETRSLASSTATTGFRGRHSTDRRGQEMTDFETMGTTTATDVDACRQSELTITKCAMLQRFLDNIDSQVASPPFIHDQPPSMLSDPVIDGWSKSNGDDGSSAAPSTSTSRSSSPSANVSVAREPLSTGGGSPPTSVAEHGTFDLCTDSVDWQAMLPPIDELKGLLDNDVQGPLERDDSANRWSRHRLRNEVVQWHLLDDYSKQLSDEQRRFRADDDPTTSNAVRELRLSLEESLRRCDRFIALHSRVLTTLRNGRQVLAMPYVDIGIPDFLEYGLRDADKFVVSRSEVGW
ncbi:mediator of RNA polymerase II transcription [Trichuris trichiura]|uniref:Mediator of RNA polymerase II transcription n=1 Tax=Trichuris trichiura TaxID=36087 RepID=A0A077ZF96_TRITR|nr:mediator of RNA polymerase II transcription [Trichuris trichiura]